jgi:hypothetical protein
MGVLSKGTDFTNGDQVTDTSLDNLVDNATFTTSAVDLVSTDIGGSGSIIVRDGGITTAKLADSVSAATGVTAVKIASSAVTAAKIATDAVTLPNGLIMKFGTVTGTGDQAVVFGSAFDNAVISIVVTLIDSGSADSAGTGNPNVKTGYSATGFTTYVNTSADSGAFWQAIGY